MGMNATFFYGIFPYLLYAHEAIECFLQNPSKMSSLSAMKSLAWPYMIFWQLRRNTDKSKSSFFLKIVGLLRNRLFYKGELIIWVIISESVSTVSFSISAGIPATSVALEPSKSKIALWTFYSVTPWKQNSCLISNFLPIFFDTRMILKLCANNIYHRI